MSEETTTEETKVDESTNETPTEGLLADQKSVDENKTLENDTEISHLEVEEKKDTASEKIEVPDYFPKQFWDEEKQEPMLEQMSKSYADMRKIISQGKHKVPKEYSLEKLGDDFDKDNPAKDVFLNFAKENNLSQNQFDNLITDLGLKLAELAPDNSIDAEEEKKLLGKNANQHIESMATWARGFVEKGIWSSDDFEEFKIMGGTARGLKALMKIRESYEGRIPIESQPLEGAVSDEELKAMVGDSRYKTDVGYRKKVENLFAQRYPN